MTASSTAYALAYASGASFSFNGDGYTTASSGADALALGFDAEAGDNTIVNSGDVQVLADATTGKDLNTTITVYRLAGSGGDGIAGYLSASLPLGEGRWWIYPSVGYQTFDPDSGTGDQSLTDLRLQVDYNYSDRWSFNGSISQTFGDQVSATQLLLGAHYRW